MAIDPELLDAFIKDPSAPKSPYEARIEYLRQLNKEYAAKEALKSKIYVAAPGISPEDNLKIDNKIHGTEVASLEPKNLTPRKVSPFFIVSISIVLVILAAAYIYHQKKTREKAEVKKNANESAKAEGNTNKSSYLPTTEEIMNSGLMSSGKKLAIAMIVIFTLIVILWGLTKLVKQTKNFEAAVMN